MIFYHGTTEELWKEIVKQGYIGFDGNALYLAANLSEAVCYGEIVLAVKYDPLDKDNRDNNYEEGCWQHREYTPISIQEVSQVSPELVIEIREINQDKIGLHKLVQTMEDTLLDFTRGKDRKEITCIRSNGDIVVAMNEKGRHGDLNHCKAYKQIKE